MTEKQFSNHTDEDVIKGLVTIFVAATPCTTETLATDRVDFISGSEVQNTISFSQVARIVAYMVDRSGDSNMLNYGIVVASDAFDNFTTIRGSVTVLCHPVWNATMNQFAFMGIPICSTDNSADFGGVGNECLFLYYSGADDMIDNIFASISNPTNDKH